MRRGKSYPAHESGGRNADWNWWKREPKLPRAAVGTGGITRSGSRSNAKYGMTLDETPMLLQCRVERFDLLAPCGGSLSTLPRLRRSRTPIFHRAFLPAAGTDPARSLILHLSAFREDQSSSLHLQAEDGVRLKTRLPRPLATGITAEPDELRRNRRGFNEYHGAIGSQRRKSRSRRRVLAPHAGCAPARRLQVIGRSWQFQSRPSRKRLHIAPISPDDVISSGGRFFNSLYFVRINPFMPFEFGLTSSSGYPPKNVDFMRKKAHATSRKTASR